MAAARAPMVNLLAQMAALTAANAALQPTAAIYARTAALRDKTNLLNYGNTEDRNIYKDGRSSVLSREKCFDATAEQLIQAPWSESLSQNEE